MGRLFSDRLFRPSLVLCSLLALLSFAQPAAAAPFGAGKFGENVPFGSVTSLALTLGGNVNLSLTPGGSTLSGTGSTTVTVTTTAVEGYVLFMYGNGSTNLVNGSATIPASTNTTAATLSTNTWGYNTAGSTTNFIGLTTSPVRIKSGTGPFKSGDTTTVTFGVLVSNTKQAGKYTGQVTYTVAALN